MIETQNIAFHYLYRDGANYKNFNTVIFDNPDNIALDVLDRLLKEKLIGEEYFYASDWKIPDMHFGSWESEFDHEFHQFGMIEYTNQIANSEISLSEFMDLVISTKWV